MDIVYLIIYFLLHFFTAFLLMYCSSFMSIWGKNGEIVLKKPSIYDLDSLDDIYIVDKYVNETIIPSSKYFELRKLYEDFTDNLGCFTAPILQFSSLLLIIKQLDKILVDIKSIFIPIIALIVCILGCAIIFFIFKRTPLYVKSFDMNKKEIEERFIYIYEAKDYPLISKETALNNYIMQTHSWYLYTHEHSIRFRLFIRKILSAISVIIYLLFFFRAPN